MASLEAFYAEFGRRLRTTRAARGLTQGEVGARLVPPVTRASIANLESGKQRVLAHTLVQLARVLDVEVGALVTFDPPSAARTAIIDELREKLGLTAAQATRLGRKLGLGAEGAA